jgi:hypothetical protein
MHPSKMTEFIERKKYSTETATLIASDEYWMVEQSKGRGAIRFYTARPTAAISPSNRFQWQGERDIPDPITQAEAIALFEDPLTEHQVKYSEAFL